jgi:hypothetical protein
MRAIRMRSMLTMMAAVVLTGAVAAQESPSGPTAASLSDAEQEQFLQHAEVLRTRGVSTGITGTKRATLSDGKLTHDASFQTVDIYQNSFQTASGTELNFRDSYKYNIAAYRLDRLLGLGMVPVSVLRKIGGDTGAATWWVDNVRMMEKDRFQKKIEVPDSDAWNDQMYQVRVFNELVYNTDPNLGNLLITKDWKLRMIDFSRAFRLQKDLREPKNLERCRLDRRVYNGLRGLNRQMLDERLGDVLRDMEIVGVLARRDRIMKHFDEQIAKVGEQAAICDFPGH